jgi:hypothetical protein
VFQEVKAHTATSLLALMSCDLARNPIKLYPVAACPIQLDGITAELLLRRICDTIDFFYHHWNLVININSEISINLLTAVPRHGLTETMTWSAPVLPRIRLLITPNM